jgi:hypothetical protein
MDNNFTELTLAFILSLPQYRKIAKNAKTAGRAPLILDNTDGFEQLNWDWSN